MKNYSSFLNYLESYIIDATTLWGFKKLHIPYLLLEATYFYLKYGGDPP